jgi:hypothetical protein
VLLKIVYLLICRVPGLIVVLARGDLAAAAEMLVLRHANSVQQGDPAGRFPQSWTGIRLVRAARGSQIASACVTRVVDRRAEPITALPGKYQNG